MGSSIRKPLRTLYDDDFYAWSLSQGNALRELRPAGIDWENLAEEVEALAKKDRRALKSCTRTLLAHLLKLRYWRSERAANERLWRSSIRNSRQEIHDILADSPSLMSFLEREYHDCYRMAAADVADLAGVAVPKSPPWRLSAVLNEAFFAQDKEGPDGVSLQLAKTIVVGARSVPGTLTLAGVPLTSNTVALPQLETVDFRTELD